MSDMSPTVELVFRTIAAARGLCELDEPQHEPVDQSLVCGVPRSHCVVLVVLAAFDELVNRGFISGPTRLLDSGVQKHIELLGAGFCPTTWEIVSATRELLGGAQ